MQVPHTRGINTSASASGARLCHLQQTLIAQLFVHHAHAACSIHKQNSALQFFLRYQSQPSTDSSTPGNTPSNPIKPSTDNSGIVQVTISCHSYLLSRAIKYLECFQ